MVTFWLGRGAIPATAAARAGINEKTLQSWLRSGYAGKPGFAEFTEAFDEALVKFECKLLEFIEGNANKNVSAATWLFNLRFGKKYAKFAELEAAAIDAEPNAPAKAVAEPTEDEIAAAERRAEEASAGVH